MDTYDRLPFTDTSDFFAPVAEPFTDTLQDDPPGDLFTGDFGFSSGARVLPREEERRLMSRLRLAKGNAVDKARKRDSRAFRDRQAFDLDEKVQEYEGQPNVTTSGTRSKVTATAGHILATIETEPLFSARSHTPEATEVSPIYEVALERELDLAGAKARILGTVLEAAKVGTSVLGLELVTKPTGELALQVTTTRVENFYCYPVEVNDLSQSSTFRRFKRPLWELRDMATAGFYDPLVVAKLKGHSSGENLTKEADDDNAGDTTLYDENDMIELWEAYYRFTPAGSDVSVLYQVVFTENSEEPLACRENPYGMAFDAPPHALARLDVSEGYLWGTSVATLLRAGQKITDDAINDLLAYGQITRTPVIEADRSSALARTYTQGFRPRPGDIIQRNGPQNAGVNVLQFPPATGAEREMAIAKSEMDDATFQDHMLQGEQYAQGRRTKYEVQTAYGSSAIKLKTLLRNFKGDMEHFVKMLWAALYAFKIEPDGVYSVYKDGTTSLLSADEIDARTVAAELDAAIRMGVQTDPEFAGDVAERVLLNPETQEVAYYGNIKLVNGGVPSARRDDVSFTLTGTAISTDRMEKVAAFSALAPFMGMLSMAFQDSRVWHICKDLLEAHGFKAYQNWIGQDPQVMNMQVYQQALMAQAEASKKSVVQ